VLVRFKAAISISFLLEVCLQIKKRGFLLVYCRELFIYVLSVEASGLANRVSETLIGL